MARPLKYKKPSDLKKDFTAYKKKCAENTREVVLQKAGVVLEVKSPLPINKIGFCAFAGITAQTLRNYKEKSDGFRDLIRQIETECEADLVEGILTGRYVCPAGIFTLKNHHNYVDKKEIDFNAVDRNLAGLLHGFANRRSIEGGSKLAGAGKG
jgi:hypothetical protein